MHARIRKTQPAPFNLADVFARNRALFGDARMDGSDDGGGQDGSGSGSGDDGGAGAAGSGGSGSAGGAGTGGGEAQNVEDLPDWAQKLIKDTRSEAAGHRTAKTAAEQKNADLLAGIGKALGLTTEDADDPKILAEKLATATTGQRTALVELAVHKAAGKHSGDPAALLDSRSFLEAVKDLDPASDTFATDIDAAITKAVADNPKLKAAPAAGKSGTQAAGGSGEQGQRPKSIQDALSRASA